MLERHFGATPLANVADERAERWFLQAGDRHGAQFDQQLLSVAMESGDFTTTLGRLRFGSSLPVPPDRGETRSAPSGGMISESSGWPMASAARPTKNLLGMLTPFGDPPGGVGEDHSVERRVEDQSIPQFAHPQDFFGPRQRQPDVAVDQPESQQAGHDRQVSEPKGDLLLGD